MEPGAFRTNFIGSHKFPAAGLNKDYDGTVLDRAMHIWDTFAGKQPGDPVKAVSRMLEVIQGTGLSTSTPHFLRLPLGTDCFPRMQAKLQEVQQNLDAMKAISLSTAVDSE